MKRRDCAGSIAVLLWAVAASVASLGQAAHATDISLPGATPLYKAQPNVIEVDVDRNGWATIGLTAAVQNGGATNDPNVKMVFDSGGGKVPAANFMRFATHFESSVPPDQWQQPVIGTLGIYMSVYASANDNSPTVANIPPSLAPQLYAFQVSNAPRAAHTFSVKPPPPKRHFRAAPNGGGTAGGGGSPGNNGNTGNTGENGSSSSPAMTQPHLEPSSFGGSTFGPGQVAAPPSDSGSDESETIPAPNSAPAPAPAPAPSRRRRGASSDGE